jgi:lysozyme family protein
MKDNFEQCLALVLKEEGGYVNDSRDPGGRTNHGITQKTWETWVGHPVTEADMKNLTIANVTPLYKENYWDKINGDALPVGVDYATFDMAVNSGVARAAKTLQQICGVTADGKIGPRTIAAVEEANGREIATRICESRLAYLQGLSTWSTFGKGWGGRVSRVENIAFRMVE